MVINMKKALTAVLLTVIAAIICSQLMCSCSKDTKEEQNTPANGGVPDRVVSRPAQPDGMPNSDSQIPDVTSDSIPENTGLADESGVTSDSAVSTSDSQPANDNKPSVTDEDDNITVSEEKDLSDCKAMEYLKLLNSSKVHAVLLEASSHDNENASSIEREYFVDGNKAVFINGDTKIIMDDAEVTVIDMDEMTYYTYPREDEDTGANFGYDISDYSLVSRDEEDDGTIIEVFEISDRGGSIKSTWTFFPSGNVTVADVTKAGAFYWYSFSLIDSDVSKMDMSVPEGVIETEPEDYFE